MDPCVHDLSGNLAAVHGVQKQVKPQPLADMAPVDAKRVISI